MTTAQPSLRLPGMGKNKVYRMVQQAQAARLERIRKARASGKTLEEIGADEGITRSRVSQILDAAAQVPA